MIGWSYRYPVGGEIYSTIVIPVMEYDLIYASVFLYGEYSTERVAGEACLQLIYQPKVLSTLRLLEALAPLRLHPCL